MGRVVPVSTDTRLCSRLKGGVNPHFFVRIVDACFNVCSSVIRPDLVISVMLPLMKKVLWR